jgi:hypothetical protein
MELRGLEPLTYALPARRSSQLSYSPVECEVVSKVNACLLSVARGGQTEVDHGFVDQQAGWQQEAAVQLSAGHPELGGGEDDRLLCDGSLDVRIHHERMFAYDSDGKGPIAGETFCRDLSSAE